jgi:ribosomal protein S18 acetylase RimI-like enzyme
LTISPFTSESKQDLQDCYDLVFKDSFDDFINSLGEEESKHWDHLGSNQLPEASAVLKHGNKIIGFIGIRDDGKYIEFGPVGILPEYRGQGLSKVLMNYAIQNLIEIGRIDAFLEVGSRNQAAYNLYKSFGFKVWAMKHGYLKKLNKIE